MARRSSNGNFDVHLLDMGRTKFGDAILCLIGGKTILVDGGHRSDLKGQDGFDSIPDQLEALIGRPPFKLDLLVVTHTHDDHIGCLPEMVAQGLLSVRWALVADEKLGFGRTPGEDAPVSLSAADRLAAALREEDHAQLDDAALKQFIEDAASLEGRYIKMLGALKRLKTKIVRFGRNDVGELETAFASARLKVIGPSRNQLVTCAEAIRKMNERAGDFLSDAAGDLVGAYRRATSGADSIEGAEDRPGKGAAVNNQSIVFKLGPPNAQVLLAGDCQFAVPEVSGVKPLMTALRRAVRSAGPYDVIKLSHHASHNGLDESVLEEWKETRVLVTSGGSDDPTHPHPRVLELLSEHAKTIKFARTDRNGQITVRFRAGRPELAKSRGDFDDFTPNEDIVEMVPASRPPLVRYERGSATVAELSATAKVPPDVSRVVVTFDIQRPMLVDPPQAPVEVVLPPRERNDRSSAARSDTLAGGRKLPPLLFVSHPQNLQDRLGRQETAEVFDLVRSGGQTLYLVRNVDDAVSEVRKQLATGRFEGVVILGNYDVVPSRRLDTLPPSLRRRVGAQTSDADNFVVWSDEAYGDVDGNGGWDIPVSRIPDGKSPKLMTRALTAAVAPPQRKTRFGVRNLARPFADRLFEQLPGAAPIRVSLPVTPFGIGAHAAGGSGVYVMLHGSQTDATRFWGEDRWGDTIEAVNTTNVPSSIDGVVFSGCCWGALPVCVTAKDWLPGQRLGGRTPGTSIALGYLEAGAMAFIGCTGTHYSPTVPPYEYFGGPMHRAFWKHFVSGKPAAKALFDAKADFLTGLPHGQTGLIPRAIEFKILREYCCLGLGW